MTGLLLMLVKVYGEVRSGKELERVKIKLVLDMNGL